MSSGIAPSRYETRRRNTVQRFYNFEVAPVTKRNTFTDATILTKPPAVTIYTAGLVAQNNKLVEVTPEYWFDDNQSGGIPSMASSARGDMRHSIKALISAFSVVGSETNLDATGAFVSLGFGSWDTATPPAASGAGCGFFEVRRSLRNPLNFWCVSRNGVTGDLYTSPIVTLPDLGTILYGLNDHVHKCGGEIVEIYFDAGNRHVYAWARGVLICAMTNPTYYPREFASVAAYPAPVVRFAVFSGPQTNPCGVAAHMAGLMVEDYFEDTIPGGSL